MAKSKKSAKEKDLNPSKAEKPAKEKKVKKEKAPAAKAEKKAAVKKVVIDPIAPVKKIAKIAAAIIPDVVVSISNDEISLRAYFIGERRQAMGWPGDSVSDWAEAERQLKAEAKKKAKR